MHTYIHTASAALAEIITAEGFSAIKANRRRRLTTVGGCVDDTSTQYIRVRVTIFLSDATQFWVLQC